MLGPALTSLLVGSLVPQATGSASAAALLDRLDARLATAEARAAHPFVVLRGTIQVPGMAEAGTFEERHAPALASRHERVLVTNGFAGWGSSTQGTDGTVSWTTDPAFGIHVSCGDEQGGARRLWALSRSASWRTMYADATVLGEVERDGRRVLDVALTPRAADAATQAQPEHWYVDPRGPDLVAVALTLPNPTGGSLPMEFVYGDWRAVDGVLYAHERVQKVGTMALTYRLEAVEHPAQMSTSELAPPEEVVAALQDPAKRSRSAPLDLEACTVRTLDSRAVASVRLRVDATEVSANLAVMLTEVMSALGEQGVQPAGPPFSRYHEIDPKTNTIDLEAGIPVARPVTAKGRVQPGELPGGRVATTWHQGSYHELPQTYARLENWMKSETLKARGGFWEIYWTDPGIEPDPASWKTEVLWPID